MVVARRKVLCVDDEPHVLRALQWLLQKEFDIQTTTTVAEGLRLVQAQDFDVVVSDQRMPGITGVEFLREVRQVAPRAMRILLTGYSDLDAMIRSVNESEVFRFITKPWDIRTLPKLIAEAAEIARAEPVAAAQSDAARLAGNVVQFSRTGSPAPRIATAPSQREITTVAVHAAESLLVIDDNQEVHDAVAKVIGDKLPVVHSFNLAQAVRTLNEKPISVIVSDVRVGNIDATRLLRLMKQAHPEIVSVVFSAQKDATQLMTLINEGQIFRLIPKPVRPEFIRLVIESAMKRHLSLVGSPAMQRRFAVQATPQGTAEAVLEDVGRIASAGKRASTGLSLPGGARPPEALSAGGAADRSSKRTGGLFSKLGAGFGNLFGT